MEATKKIVRETTNPTAANSSVYSNLDHSLSLLEANANALKRQNVVTATDSSMDALLLPNHKNKAILFTLSKLPIATSIVLSDTSIKNSFVLNGQLDITHNLVPSFDQLLNIYRGNIKNTCLQNKETII